MTDTKTITKTIKQHSMLSPSSSSMWLNCTPSAAMAALMPEQETVYTGIGTDAHTLAERKLRLACGDNSVKSLTEGLTTFDEEMDVCTDEYLKYISTLISDTYSAGFFPEMFIEKELDLTKYIPEGKGTADFVLYAGDTIHIVDFKYGNGKRVEAKNNSQMRIYALGVLEALRQENFKASTVIMTIFQPRMGNVESDSISCADLEAWAKETLEPKAQFAIKGEGELVEGSWCDFCAARVLCKKKREAQIKSLTKLSVFMEDYKEALNEIRKDKNMDKETKEKAKRNLLSNDEISTIIHEGAGMGYWISQINEYALNRALEGEEFKNLKLIADVSPSRLPEEAAEVIKGLGCDPYKPQELKSKSAIERELGKKVFAINVAPLLVPGEEKAKLVDINDKAEAKDYSYFAK